MHECEKFRLIVKDYDRRREYCICVRLMILCVLCMEFYFASDSETREGLSVVSKCENNSPLSVIFEADALHVQSDCSTLPHFGKENEILRLGVVFTIQPADLECLICCLI